MNKTHFFEEDMNYSPANTAIKKASFELELNRPYNGDPILSTVLCRFRYTWDFIRNQGAAYLIDVNEALMNIRLYPTSIQGMWDFVSAIPPTRYLIGKRPVVLYRVALNIDPFTGEESAAMLFGPYGSSIMGTSNFDPYCTALTA